MSFLNETNPPALERGSGPVKNPVISLLPNQPRSNDKGIHEEIVMKLTLASYIIE
jgi:hypothetical protein